MLTPPRQRSGQVLGFEVRQPPCSLDNSVEAHYTVFADTSTDRWAATGDENNPFALLLPDYVITQDAPGEKIRPGDIQGMEYGSASVKGTTDNVSVVPLPAAVWGGMVLLGGLGGADAAAAPPR